MQIENKSQVYFFYLIIIIASCFVCLSEPFLRYPYDVFAHLIAIDEKFYNHSGTTTNIQPGRLIWHTIWGKIFQILDIKSNDIFLRAKIIHVVQTYIALFSIYYFSVVLLRNLFKQINTLTLKYLSLWSVFIWFSIYATFSMHYHLIWNLWYSVSYQITLPLFFYMTALTLVLFLEEVSLNKKIFFLVQILFIFLFILKAHPMELIYYGMYVFTFSLVYRKKVFRYVKNNIYLILMLFSIFVYLVIYFDVEEPTLFTYFTPSTIGLLYSDMVNIGKNVVEHYNRSQDVINELMLLIFYSTLFMGLFLVWTKEKSNKVINQQLFIFTLLTSLFILIPQYVLSAGLFSLMTKPYVVHRVYYSSSLFILLPVAVYYFAQHYKWKLYQINALLFFLFVVSLLYSKSFDTYRHNYYKNVQSLVYSFTDKYAFHFSKEDIKYIGERIRYYEKVRIHKDRDNLYFARDDIAFVLKYIYRKRVYWTGRRETVNYHRAYVKNAIYTRYNYILFTTKKDFPENPYFE